MNPKKIFTKRQKLKIRTAIQEAENCTSGEIRLHIENRCQQNPIDRAKEVFFDLQMDMTEERNGILIYIAIADKKMAIIGDEGIDKVTSEDYWQSELDLLLTHFKQSDYVNGLTKVINNMGEKLKVYFPIKPNDINELSDEISFFNN